MNDTTNMVYILGVYFERSTAAEEEEEEEEYASNIAHDLTRTA